MLDAPTANLTHTEKKVLDLIAGRPITLTDAVTYYIEVSGKRDDRKFTQSVQQALTFFVDYLAIGRSTNISAVRLRSDWLAVFNQRD